MTDDPDRTWKWAFRKGYGRSPRGDELDRYRYWHGISRRISFDAAGPWQTWPSKPIPPDAVVPEPARCPRPSRPRFTVTLRTEERRDVVKAEPTPKPATTSPRGEVPAKRRGRPPRVQQARALLRQHLADGPRPGTEIEAAAQAAEIPKRELLAACDGLDVRSQRGQWWLPG
jgi:hypothetical protein